MRTSITKRVKYKSINAPDLDVDYAGLGKRTLATIIDLFIIYSLVAVLNLILFPSDYLNNEFIVLKVIIGIFFWIFYNGILESSALQATMGELLLKIKVIDLYGKQMSFLGACLRSMAIIVSILPMGLGIWYMTTDLKSQGWHDMISGSYVIET